MSKYYVARALDTITARDLASRLADRFYVRAQLYSNLADASSADPRECGHKASELMAMHDDLRDLVAGRKCLDEVC